MVAKWVPAVRTPATPDVVSRAYRHALTDLVGPVSDTAVAILHSHGALETAHFASCFNGNAGNIKTGRKWEGLYCAIKLNEVLKRDGRDVTVWFDPRGELTSKNGTIVPGTESEDPPGHVQCRMRAYDSLAEGVRDKIKFLAGGVWRPALDMALAGDAAGYVRAIRVRDYFTAPLEPYSRAVVSLTQKFLPVARDSRAQPAELTLEAEEQICLDMEACARFMLPEWLRNRVQQISALTAAEAYDQGAEERRRARDAAIRGAADGWDDPDDGDSGGNVA